MSSFLSDYNDDYDISIIIHQMRSDQVRGTNDLLGGSQSLSHRSRTQLYRIEK